MRIVKEFLSSAFVDQPDQIQNDNEGYNPDRNDVPAKKFERSHNHSSTYDTADLSWHRSTRAPAEPHRLLRSYNRGIS